MLGIVSEKLPPVNASLKRQGQRISTRLPALLLYGPVAEVLKNVPSRGSRLSRGLAGIAREAQVVKSSACFVPDARCDTYRISMQSP